MVQRRQRKRNADAVELGQLRQDIDVAGYEMIFRHDHYRIAMIEQYLQTAPGELSVFFDRLVAIGVAAQRDQLRLPFGTR
jgi:hypothetical protein